jgi:hypothetical protein
MKNKIVTVIAVTLLFTTPSYSGQLQTSFQFSETIGEFRGNSRTYTLGVTDPGNKLVLPAAFTDWNCIVTPKHISDDGQKYFHNMVCTQISTGVIVGQTIECDVNRPSTDTNAIWFRSTSPATVTFEGTCKTEQVGSVPAGNSF